MVKTIAISSFHPFISRNILATPVISYLLDASRDIRIVLLVPDYKKDYFEKHFAAERVAVAGVKTGGATKLKTLFFKRFARMMLDTETARIQKRSKLYIEGGLFYFLASYVAVGMGKFTLVRKILRFLDYWFADTERFDEIIFSRNPDIIVATDVQNEHNVSLLQAARFYGIPAVAMVRSWDNLTSLQGLMRIIPDTLLVPTAELRREAQMYHDMPQDRVHVVGIPHYDRYRSGKKMPKEEFFRALKLDPAKKTVLYTTLGDRYLGTGSVDQAVLETLGKLDCNVVVRCHPGDTITLNPSFRGFANMVFDRPGVIFKERNFGDREIAKEDDFRLEHELFYADVVVLCASTIAIDAAWFNKPAIGVAFAENPVSYWASPRRFYDYTHLVRVLKTGGLRLAESRDNLLTMVQEYLANPLQDKEGRERIVSEQCGFNDTESSLRVAKIILKELHAYAK